MKIGLALGCLSICLVTFADTIAQEDGRIFPYQALVVKEAAEVFSGPAAVHYSTDKLEQGATVDVYRHDPGGWCAIRPPIGSFSLLPESAVTKAGGGLARINEDGIKAWVGTRLGAVEKPLWQVKMKKDEVVQILGEISWPHPDGHSTLWFQIAPPAGEFRWIQISDIQPPKNASDLPDLQSSVSGTSQISSNFSNAPSRTQPASFQSEDPVFDDSISLDPPSVNDATVNRGWRQARTPIRVADRRNAVTASAEPFKIPAIDGPSKVDPTHLPGSLAAETARQQGSASRFGPGVGVGIGTGTGPANVALDPLSGPVSQRIRMLESSLTAEMLKTPSDWELESILRQATSIASSSNIQTEKQHAERLTTKIRKCVAIQAKFDSAYNGKSNAQGGSIARPGSQPIGAGIDNNVEFGTTYDAHGWLNQLVRGKGSLQPTYVIEDDAGRILYHVAASPGLNLNRYLKSKVGVIGRRGFHRELQLDHVTAERIVVIDSLRR